MIGTALFWADTSNTKVQFLHGLIIVVLPYLGMVLGVRKGEWLEPAKFVSLFKRRPPAEALQDPRHSVIIDGRIADIVETGFIDGTLVVPQFVLKELQYVADSADALKRNRGRRGLDILHRIQKMAGVEVVISDMDFPHVKEVDLKLIEVARSLLGRIVTNDFNLNKVAQLRGVDVLNINELANSLKPVVLPGEADDRVHPQGRQGIQPGRRLSRRRHDGGRRQRAQTRIGKNLEIVVTSVLQTTAGRMIFGRHADGGVATPQDSAAARRDRRTRRLATPAGVRDPQTRELPPFHWWRTVFFLIPAVATYTIVLGIVSLIVGVCSTPAAGWRTGARSCGRRRLWSRRGVQVRLGRTSAAARTTRAACSSPIIRASTTRRLFSRGCRGN